MISKILLATDDSKVAKKAFRFAMTLAGQLKASIILLTVIDERAYFAQSIPVGTSASLIGAPVDEYLRSGAEKYLEQAQRMCNKSGIKCRSVTRNGRPVDEIIKEAKKSKVDMIVMGSHGKGTLESAVLGSVTYGVIHKDMKYPVLVIR